MDDNAKNAASYQLDQEILDERGINMTVEEVAGLSTCKYSERVQSLKLNDEDLVFLKGLRRRIKNRLASQNSRRRSVEHLRRLTRELRAVRACRHDALTERRALVARRDSVRDKCVTLRRIIVDILKQREDTSEVPSLEIHLSSHANPIKKVTVTQTKSPLLSECFKDELLLDEDDEIYERVREEIIAEKNELKKEKFDCKKDVFDCKKDVFDCKKDVFDCKKDIFECKISKLVQQSVNHIYKESKDEKKKVFAKTVFISNDKLNGSDEVLNLSVKEGRRKSHGRKQLAPRRIAYCSNWDDGVLDLKVKKEPQ